MRKILLAAWAWLLWPGTPARAQDLPTYGPSEINMDYRDNVTAADKKYDKWFMLGGVVQGIKKDAWDITWIDIRDRDDKVTMDYVSAKFRSEIASKYHQTDDILLVCHGTSGTRSAGDTSISLVNNCSLAQPPGAITQAQNTTLQAQNAAIPQQEADFCSIVENANSAYGELNRRRETAKSHRNGIRVEQIEQQMTSVFHQRNENVFRFAKHEKFLVNNWLVAIENIRTSSMYCRVNTTSCILVDVHPLCSPITTLHSRMEATPFNIQLLAAKQHGDQLAMSGKFLKRFSHHLDEHDVTGPPMKPEEFEESLLESGSVTEPEYAFDAQINQLKISGSELTSEGDMAALENDKMKAPAGVQLVVPQANQAYMDGRNARVAYENWLASLGQNTDYRAGAEYWAGHRSIKPVPTTCHLTSPVFQIGCEEAKRRLTPSDLRRSSEPNFKLGWNSL